MAEEKIEEETYSLIYTSLKHPIRRRILRMVAEKPLSYSEILGALTVDSGHLNYHLESLGELISHTKDGNYTLSSFGVAALRLMNGVEEIPPQSPNKKQKNLRHMPKVLSFILVISLIAASIHFLTYTSPIATSTLDQDYILPTPFTVNLNQTFEFYITVEYWNNDEFQFDNATFLQMRYPGPQGPETYTFDSDIFQASLSAQVKSVMWLDLRFDSIKGTYSATGGNFSGNLTSVHRPDADGAPIEIETDVYMPTENKSLGGLNPIFGQSDRLHFTSPAVEVNQLGTYRFFINTNKPSEWTTLEYYGSITPNLQWQIIEKPYFNYGILGFVISAGYISLVTYITLKSKNARQLNNEIN